MPDGVIQAFFVVGAQGPSRRRIFKGFFLGEGREQLARSREFFHVKTSLRDNLTLVQSLPLPSRKSFQR